MLFFSSWPVERWFVERWMYIHRSTSHRSTGQDEKKSIGASYFCTERALGKSSSCTARSIGQVIFAQQEALGKSSSCSAKGIGASYFCAAKAAGQFCRTRASGQITCVQQGQRGQVICTTRASGQLIHFFTARASEQVIIFAQHKQRDKLHSKSSGASYYYFYTARMAGQVFIERTSGQIFWVARAAWQLIQGQRGKILLHNNGIRAPYCSTTKAAGQIILHCAARASMQSFCGARYRGKKERAPTPCCAKTITTCPRCPCCGKNTLPLPLLCKLRI